MLTQTENAASKVKRLNSKGIEWSLDSTDVIVAGILVKIFNFQKHAKVLTISMPNCQFYRFNSIQSVRICDSGLRCQEKNYFNQIIVIVVCHNAIVKSSVIVTLSNKMSAHRKQCAWQAQQLHNKFCCGNNELLNWMFCVSRVKGTQINKWRKLHGVPNSILPCIRKRSSVPITRLLNPFMWKPCQLAISTHTPRKNAHKTIELNEFVVIFSSTKKKHWNYFFRSLDLIAELIIHVAMEFECIESTFWNTMFFVSRASFAAQGTWSKECAFMNQVTVGAARAPSTVCKVHAHTNIRSDHVNVQIRYRLLSLSQLIDICNGDRSLGDEIILCDEIKIEMVKWIYLLPGNDQQLWRNEASRCKST